jgi:hypothetical protein
MLRGKEKLQYIKPNDIPIKYLKPYPQKLTLNTSLPKIDRLD